MANLAAALQRALDQQHLLALRQLQQFIGGNLPYDIRKISRHPVVLDSEDLDHACIVEERIRLRAVNLELRSVLSERPHGKPAATQQRCRHEQRLQPPEISDFIAKHERAFLQRMPTLRQQHAQPRKP
jgi:hypothetical protein